MLDKYRKLGGEKALAFCASISHAEYMAEYFSINGISSATVHSGANHGEYLLERGEAVLALQMGRVRVLFVVDMFNEGVDIPSIDTVMFLRPTESFVVFLQQLGRGLRQDKDKLYLNVLDFIGNYKRAHYIPALLAGENPMAPQGVRSKKPADYDFPEGCLVQFEFRVLDLFEEMARLDPLRQRMQDDYCRLKDSLGRKVTRVDVLEGSDIPAREFFKNGWLGFLDDLGELDAEERQWLNTPAEDFLRELEKTLMNRAYKIPTILALIKGGQIVKQVPLSEVGERFMSFYKEHPLHQQDFRDKSNRNWQT